MELVSSSYKIYRSRDTCIWTSGCIEAPPIFGHTVTVLQNARSYANFIKNIGFGIFHLVEMQSFIAHTRLVTYIAIFQEFAVYNYVDSLLCF